MRWLLESGLLERLHVPLPNPVLTLLPAGSCHKVINTSKCLFVLAYGAWSKLFRWKVSWPVAGGWKWMSFKALSNPGRISNLAFF